MIALAIDGLLMRMLWRDDPAAAAGIEAALCDIIGG